jgi:hypothetical protein
MAAFESLLWRCLIPGRTGFDEQGLSARIKPEGEETILVFRSDTKVFRDSFGLPPESKVSDAIFFFKSEAPRPVVLFLELKGTHIEHAAKQLTTVIKAIRLKMDAGVRNETDYRAIILASGSAPVKADPIWQRFEKETGVSLRIKTVRKRGKSGIDLREYLRSG